jgi:stearoyl-CoA desaturase (delta-9 desaturase)
LNKFNVIFLGINHFFAAYGLICVLAGKELMSGAAYSWKTLAWTLVLYVVGGLGITAGVHRLWAHRSYSAAAPLRAVLMLANSIAFQGSIFHWARDHRTHHRHTDEERDPHDATKGLFYSHIGCYLLKKDAAVKDAGKDVDISDLYKDGVVMFQKKYYLWFAPLMSYVMPGLVAHFFWGERIWTGIVLAGFMRYVLLLHATWCINSLTHAFGGRPYDDKEMATENRFTAFFALGEGWHNWHHTFAHDYATAELGSLQQWNPTKMFIDLMAIFGLVWGRKRATKMWDARKELYQRKGFKVEESLEGPMFFKVRKVTLKEVAPTQAD